MRKSIFVTMLCGLWIVVGTAVHAAKVTVFHGSKTEIFDTAKTPAGGVRILRMSIKSEPKPVPVAADRATAPRRLNASWAAGDTFWTHNVQTGKLVACFAGSAGKVGKWVIRCTDPKSMGR